MNGVRTIQLRLMPIGKLKLQVAASRKIWQTGAGYIFPLTISPGFF